MTAGANALTVLLLSSCGSLQKELESSLLIPKAKIELSNRDRREQWKRLNHNFNKELSNSLCRPMSTLNLFPSQPPPELANKISIIDKNPRVPMFFANPDGLLYVQAPFILKIHNPFELIAMAAISMAIYEPNQFDARFIRWFQRVEARYSEKGLNGFELEALFGRTGPFFITPEETEGVISQTIGILHRARYDLRGLPKLIQIWNQKEFRWPYTETEMEWFQAVANQEHLRPPPIGQEGEPTLPWEQIQAIAKGCL